MRRLLFISIAGLLILTACNDVRKPNNANFTKAINQYLAKHGQPCVSIGQTFPINVPESEQQDQYGIAPEMAVLAQAGLVRSTNTVVAMPGVLGPGAPRPVRRYALTADGKKYFRQTPGILGKNGEFCYGQETVDAIVKWTEPMRMGPYSQTEVAYTYKLVNLAGWAKRTDIQRVFPDVRMTISGASKADQIAGLQLTNKGWEVPKQ